VVFIKKKSNNKEDLINKARPPLYLKLIATTLVDYTKN